MSRGYVRAATGVCVHAGEEGVLYYEVGRIVISRASSHGVDRHLWDCLRIAVDRLSLVIDVHPLDADWGQTVKIVAIGKETGVGAPATLSNPEAIRMAEYLRLQCFHCGEDPTQPTLRFGPPQTAFNPTVNDHTNHLYLSLPRPRRFEAGSGELDPEILSHAAPDEATDTFLDRTSPASVIRPARYRCDRP